MKQKNDKEKTNFPYDSKKEKGSNPYMDALHSSNGKACIAVDQLGKIHSGIIIGFNPVHLNIVIRSDDTGKIRFIRNLIWFEYNDKE
jgi:hypothetical protein